MRTITTIQGDMVDAIARREYGDESGYVEKILEANPGLADRGLVLDAGITVVLPDIDAPAALPSVSLWD
jgi:phage tail protein X